MIKKTLALALLAAMTIPAFADDNALIDALVRKGVLSRKEADQVRAEVAQQSDSASKIKINDSLTELKLYGDARLRGQWDNRDPQAPVATNSDQRFLWRFRLRLAADFKYGSDFFGGIGIETSQASDSTYQTFQDGFADYGIFLSKVYLGWNAADWLTVVAGKQPNPFYTTDLVWDADINPQGLVEIVKLNPLWGNMVGGGMSGYSKDKVVIEDESGFEFTLIAGQFIFDDNNEWNADDDSSTDAYLFQTQVVAKYKFDKSTSITFAPGYYAMNAAELNGLNNSNQFDDVAAISGEARELNILLAPGDYSFVALGQKMKFYWDFAYNITGGERMEQIYQFNADGLHNDATDDAIDKNWDLRDSIAWLVGFQVGSAKKAGDWMIYGNYREIGLASIDPNTNDSDFAFSELNTRGFRVGASYNFTDFLSVGVTGTVAWNLNEDLIGFQATTGEAIAQDNASQIVQVDLGWKF